MLSFLDPPEIILIIVVVLVLFGGSQLPKLAKNLGKAQKEFKDGLAEALRSPRKLSRRRSPRTGVVHFRSKL
jgi:sec-independent protein translocase protein TatA